MRLYDSVRRIQFVPPEYLSNGSCILHGCKDLVRSGEVTISSLAMRTTFSILSRSTAGVKINEERTLRRSVGKEKSAVCRAIARGVTENSITHTGSNWFYLS
mmetsp:Transcript_4083/g.6024  ORF Transcript_4083/g.6024 Transcript_4083/m.6024 type:complete len:102 (-) Transcript_4083:59-364(-)